VDELETMSTGEHFMCTDIEWDPTGGYIFSNLLICIEAIALGYQHYTAEFWLWYLMSLERNRYSLTASAEPGSFNSNQV
jgi:translation initiation factor 3 subunit B